MPAADQVAPAGSAATAAVSVATSPGMPPGTPITRSQCTWPPAGGPNSASSRCSVATWPRSNSSNSGTTERSCVSWYSSLMNDQGLANTSSPKFTVPQVSEQASGSASSTASLLAKLSVTAPPVESWTMRSVPSRSAATVSASLLHGAQPAAELGGHGQGVRTRGGGVRQVQRDVRAVERRRVPVRGVRHHLAAAGPERVHVLHREDDVGFLAHRGQALLEPADVLALPAERRVQHHHPGPDTLGEVLGPPQFLPRITAPDPLGQQQARRVHGHDRDLVVVTQPPQRVSVLAHQIRVDHDLDPVVPQPRGHLEGIRRAFGVDGRGRQGDGRNGYLSLAAHRWTPSVGSLSAY